MKSAKRTKAQSPHDDRRSKFWVKGVYQTSSPYEEKAFAVFQPDILVTAQYLATYQRRFHLQPEQVLMLAVLEDAVVCFQENVTAVQPRKQALFREAEDWILDDDKRYFFSFENICEALGVSPAYLRRGLKRWKEDVFRKLGNQAAQRLAVNPYGIGLLAGLCRSQQRSSDEPSGPKAIGL
jgi:hypothetical protein